MCPLCIQFQLRLHETIDHGRDQCGREAAGSEHRQHHRPAGANRYFAAPVSNKCTGSREIDSEAFLLGWYFALQTRLENRHASRVVLCNARWLRVCREGADVGLRLRGHLRHPRSTLAAPKVYGLRRPNWTIHMSQCLEDLNDSGRSRKLPDARGAGERSSFGPGEWHCAACGDADLVRAFTVSNG